MSLPGAAVDFAGREIPILYRGILDEHERRNLIALRCFCTGRLTFSAGMCMLLNRIPTRNTLIRSWANGPFAGLQ